MKSPLVSLLLPVYNATKYGEDYLPTMLESIVAQTFSDFEVLIGDDGSTDHTVEQVKPFLRDPRFKLFAWKPNRGLHQSIVALMEQARGQFWCSPGADDILEPRLLEKRVARLSAHPHAVLIHGAAQWIDGEGQPYRSEIIEHALPEVGRRLPETLPAERMLPILLQHNIINFPSTLVRMEPSRRVLPYFQPCWVHTPDWALWILLAATGGDFLWDPEPLIRYRMHGQSLSGSPRYQISRRVERKLAPFYALYAASRFSPLAKKIWLEERVRLYRWWLTTAVALKRRGQLKDSDLKLAKEALLGQPVESVSLGAELLRHGLPMAIQYAQERRARAQQYLPVAGFPLIQEPLFQRAGR
jgi:glycosyltransferase involved in cell wall biosynthesis